MRTTGGFSFTGMTLIPPPPPSSWYVSFINNSAIDSYVWNSATGFGTKFTRPGGMASWQGGLVYSPDNLALAYQNSASPYTVAYRWSDSGIGSKYTDPGSAGTLAGNPNYKPIAFNRAGNWLVSVRGDFPGQSANRIKAYPWNSTTGFGTAISQPSYAGVNCYGIAFHPSDNAVIIVGVSGVGVGQAHAYAWSNSTGFGSAYTLPGDLTSYGTIADVAFSPNGNYVAFAVKNSPYLVVYPWNSATGFGSKVANPGTLASSVSTTNAITFTKTGDAIILCGRDSGGSGLVAAYAWTGSAFSSKYTNPNLSSSGEIYNVTMSPDNSAVLFGARYGIRSYAWNSATGFGSAYTDPLGGADSTVGALTFTY